MRSHVVFGARTTELLKRLHSNIGHIHTASCTHVCVCTHTHTHTHTQSNKYYMKLALKQVQFIVDLWWGHVKQCCLKIEDFVLKCSTDSDIHYLTLVLR